MEILKHLDDVPEQWQTSLRNNGGGYLNHIFYWEGMCHAPSHQQPSGELANDIAATFGSFEQFKAQFTAAGGALFGSGYVWLCQCRSGGLHIVTTSNQDCPLTSDLYPLLVLDVWEHAYYLKHQNRRTNYIDAWWGVVCWEAVGEIRNFWEEYLIIHDNSHKEL